MPRGPEAGWPETGGASGKGCSQGAQTSSIAQGHVRKAESQTLPRPPESEPALKKFFLILIYLFGFTEF